MNSPAMAVKTALYTILLAVGLLQTAAAQMTVYYGDDSGLQPVQLLPVNPETPEDMLKISSLVVRGTVASVRELDSLRAESPEGTVVMNVRRRMAAEVNVEEIYKGGFSGENLNVIFLVSDIQENPPLMSLNEGEDVVLFLMPGPNPPYYVPVSYHGGKMWPSPQIEDILRSRTVKEEKDSGELTLSISMSGDSFKAGMPIYATVMIMNNTNRPVRVDSSLDPVKVLAISGPVGNTIPPLAISSPPEIDRISLQPRHFTGARYDLAEYFKLSEPGEYFVRAAIPSPEWKGGSDIPVLASKTISFIVE